MTTKFTLTGNFADLLGVDLPGSKIVASLGTNLGAVALVDLDANKVYPPNPVRLAVADNGTFSVTLIATNSTGTNITDGTLRYVLTVEYRDAQGRRHGWNSGYFELTANTDLSDVAESDVAMPVTPLPAPAVIDAATAANVGNTGSQTATALTGKYQLRPTGSGFVAFGDSISTAQDKSAGGGGYGGAWPQMACALSQQRLNFRGNAGVSGDTSTQIRARISDAIALAPSVVTILAGANNITAAGSDGAPAFATFKDDIRAICNTLRAAGIRVALCTILPRGGESHTATRLTTTLKWNAWLREYARDGAEFPDDRGGFELIDFFDLMVDPATGQLKTAYDLDGLHPSQAGHLVMAQYVVDKIQTLAYKPLSATINTGDTYNLLANPLMVNGTPTPTSWITSGSATADWTEGLVTDTDFKGKAWEVAFASAASSSNFRAFKSFTISSGFAAGDVLLYTFRTKITASTSVVPSTTAGLRVQLLTASGEPATHTPIGGLSVVSGSALHWFRITVPPGTTTLQTQTVVGSLPVGAAFTARVGEFGLFNLTTMGLA